MTDSFDPSTNSQEKIKRLKESLIKQIFQEFEAATISDEDLNQFLVDLILQKFHAYKSTLPEEIRNPLFHQVINDVLGFGLLQPYIDDPAITQITVNGKDNILLEMNGQIIQAAEYFTTEEELTLLISRNLKRLGLHLDPENPVLDEHLPDGSQVMVVLPPIAVATPILSIIKQSPCKVTISDLLESRLLNEEILEFLQACVLSRLNILVSGLGDTGKTSLINSIAAFIPETEKIVTIEEIPQLNLPQKNVFRLENRSLRQEGKPFSTPTDLVHLSLRIHPERLIIDEMRGAECLAVLQAMDTGCSGSIATIHADSTVDAVAKMETMCLMTGVNFPIRVIHEKIASPLDLIIQLSRLKDGSRRITAITEISGMESENIILTDIFRFEQTGIDPQGRVVGSLKPTGIRPLFTARLEANGYTPASELFGPNLARLVIDKNIN